MRLLLLALLLLFGVPARAAIPTVAAAADLRYAMDELVALYGKKTGRQVKVIYGSSGIFYQQIAAGAPFELFLSADEAYVQRLEKAGLTRDGGTVYARGRIVLFAPKASKLVVDAELAGLRRALDRGEVRRFAIANPTHAPYGERAREALLASGLWPALEQKLVLGENVSQAMQFATTGGADGGIFALSLAKAPGVARLGQWVLIPERLHRPLLQRMVLTRKSTTQARAFYSWLQGPEARTVFERYGFTVS